MYRDTFDLAIPESEIEPNDNFNMERVKFMINKFESAGPESGEVEDFKYYICYLEEELDDAIEIVNLDRLAYLNKVVLYLAGHFYQYYGATGNAGEIADLIMDLIDLDIWQSFKKRGSA